jgi:opacity protein-like surface antigen
VPPVPGRILGRMIRFALIFSLLTLAGSFPAAAEGDPYGYVDRSGPYIGLAVAVAGLLEVDDEFEDDTGLSDIVADFSEGLQARAGYRVHPLFGVEVNFEWLSEFEIEGGEVGTLGELEVRTLTADAKLFLPNWKNGQFFLLAGAGVLGAEFKDTLGLGVSEDETDFAARFGAGIDIYLTKNIAVTVEASYVFPTGDVKHLDYVSGNAGLQYRF